MQKNIILFTALGILTALLIFTDLIFGVVKIPLREIINYFLLNNTINNDWLVVIHDFRVPKTMTAILAGAALSVSGLQMQTVFKNPLAGPYILGISSGASLGVAFLLLGYSVFNTIIFGFMQNLGIVFAAWLGSAVVLMIILAVSMRVRDVMTILVLGILFSSATSAFVSILQYFSSESLLKFFVIWTMGSLGGITRNQLTILIPVILLGFIIAILSIKKLNALLLGENYAQTLGINIKQSRIIIFLSTSILTGTITAFCGPIGFIDIAVPHVARIMFKSADHKKLMFACMFLGADILLLSDIVSQLFPGGNLPINSVTALFGIPVIVWIILGRKL